MSFSLGIFMFPHLKLRPKSSWTVRRPFLTERSTYLLNLFIFFKTVGLLFIWWPPNCINLFLLYLLILLTQFMSVLYLLTCLFFYLWCTHSGVRTDGKDEDAKVQLCKLEVNSDSCGFHPPLSPCN